MRMRDQVVCLELSNQVKELGLPQNGIFAWYQYENQKPFVNLKDFQNYIENENLIRDGDVVSPNMICDALTVAELGEMLPSQILHGVMSTSYYFSVEKCDYNEDIDWRVKYRNEGIYDTFHFVNADTEVDACAKMWIYLKKEKIMK